MLFNYILPSVLLSLDLIQAIRGNMNEYFEVNQAKLSLAARTAVNKILRCTSTESTGQTTSNTVSVIYNYI